MQLSVEISKYPLSEEYIPAIKDFLERINRHQGLKILTNTMSTQIFGEYDALMAALNQEMKVSFETYNKQVFVVKFINGDLSPKS